MLISTGALSSAPRSVKAALAASIFTAAIGSLVLCGWLFDIERLKRILPTLVAMNPTTAVAFMLLALSLWLSQKKDVSPGVLRAAKSCAALVALVGSFKLAQVIFGWPGGIDQLIFADKLKVDPTGLPNRMAPNTALNLALLGCALLLINSRRRRVFHLAQALVITSLIGSLLPIIGYLYGAKLFYGIGNFIPMAAHTAFTLLVLGTGILSSRPAGGLMLPLMDRGVSGLMLRRLLPAVIGLPIFIGWLRLEGQQQGFYNNELGVALMVAAHILILTALVWWSSFQLLSIDARRKEAETQLRDLTLTDDLTGLRNRRGFLLLAEHEIKLARHQRTGLTLWLLFADLDGLKQINDSLGHDAGSQAIVHMGTVLKQTFRESDVIARLGGDEFAILAMSNSGDSGSIMLSRLQENVRAFNLREKLAYRLSVSVGVTRIDSDQAASVEAVLKEADQAMYAEKRRRKKNSNLNPSLGNQFA
ncbi:MAG TPA: diguanylate cyclase [Pyrinomonadaceae bacterium]|nr:diguanylate cyclase [Pyrinomonadaceae bacterium]